MHNKAPSQYMWSEGVRPGLGIWPLLTWSSNLTSLGLREALKGYHHLKPLSLEKLSPFPVSPYHSSDTNLNGSFFFFFSFYGCTCGIWMFPG